MRPEDALGAAREAAARGGKREAEGVGGGDAPREDRLREWALIEVDPELVYSTRRFGGPITGVKRVLLRLLRQYTAELEAQQTRFNVGVLARLRELEERVERAERGDGSERDEPQ